jgi:ribonuclease HI/ADP-ribose pyrophosphatase YjhB (NUDIX family)
MKQIIIVQALIKKDQRVLLLQRTNPLDGAALELPGGEVKVGEDPRVALTRLIKQQLGHASQVMQLAEVISYSYNEDQVIAIVFSVSLADQNESLKLSSDYKRYDWYSLSEIQLNQTNKHAQRVLGIISDFQSTEIVKTKRDVEDTTNSKEVIVYTDGGSRGNPGPSAAGFVVLSADERVLFEGGKYLGITTNNQAEYQAVKLGLEKARELGAHVVRFKMDSLLIVNQMSGVYQIKNRDLWPIYASIKTQINNFEKVTFTHVRREFNKEADALVNKVLDERG